MSYMQPARFIKIMRKTSDLLQYNLGNLTQEQVTTARDGADGWTVLEVMCHLRDFEEIFLNRALMALHQENPTLPAYDHLAMVIENRYAEQNFAEVLAAYLATREKFMTWLAELPEADWQRTALHPEAGQITIMEMAMQSGFHAIDHLEQMQRSLAG